MTEKTPVIVADTFVNSTKPGPKPNSKVTSKISKKVQTPKVSTTTDSPTVKMFKELHADLLKTFLIKNVGYGDSFKKHGTLGIVIRMDDKVARIDSLMKQKVSKVGDESLEDTFKDLAAYSLMAVICLREEKNRKV